MIFRKDNNRFGISFNKTSLNVTPIIDIVFLLIIFFVIVSKFIEAENFPVTVPDQCDAARQPKDLTETVTTISVFTSDDDVFCAVGSKQVQNGDPRQLVAQITELLEQNLEKVPQNEKIVTLRIDKEIEYSYAQYILAAVAESSANRIKIAALNEKY